MVTKSKFKLLWDKAALDELVEIIDYIYKESPQGARIVRDSIQSQVNSIKKKPLIFEVDHLKMNNDGSFRSNTVYSYRITYKISKNQIFILRVRHTSREPLEY
ncbi:MAG: type II toxin-antitoxin system RelE/ParE family toxin [Bacteroidota bacterium]